MLRERIDHVVGAGVARVVGTAPLRRDVRQPTLVAHQQLGLTARDEGLPRRGLTCAIGDRVANRSIGQPSNLHLGTHIQSGRFTCLVVVLERIDHCERRPVDVEQVTLDPEALDPTDQHRHLVKQPTARVPASGPGRHD